MKIRLFEEYNELDFSNFNCIEKQKYLELTKQIYKLTDYELKKINIIFNFKIIYKNGFFEEYYYKYRYFINNNPVKIIVNKSDDDYYLVNVLFYGINNYYIKCDQLSELLRLLNYTKNIKIE